MLTNVDEGIAVQPFINNALIEDRIVDNTICHRPCMSILQAHPSSDIVHLGLPQILRYSRETTVVHRPLYNNLLRGTELLAHC